MLSKLRNSFLWGGGGADYDIAHQNKLISSSDKTH